MDKRDGERGVIRTRRAVFTGVDVKKCSFFFLSSPFFGYERPKTISNFENCFPVRFLPKHSRKLTQNQIFSQFFVFCFFPLG